MKKLSLVLIILGLLLIAVPLAGQWYTSYNENKMIDEWLNSDNARTAEAESGAQTAETGNAEDNYNQLQNIFSGESSGNQVPGEQQGSGGQISESSGPSGSGSTSKPVSSSVIGVIKIDKIKVKAPIVEGVTAADLRVGIGHITGTAKPGAKGNCALAGHRSYTFGKFFNRLDELKVGDLISIFTKQGEYKYKIYKKLVVLPTDVSVLKGSKQENTITLITCTPIYVATHRLIVKASLVSSPTPQP